MTPGDAEPLRTWVAHTGQKPAASSGPPHVAQMLGMGWATVCEGKRQKAKGRRQKVEGLPVGETVDLRTLRAIVKRRGRRVSVAEMSEAIRRGASEE